MKVEIPDALKQEVPQTTWGKILTATPVVMTVVATMLAGTPAISFLGAVGAALTLRVRRGGLLLALLVLPLYIPTLIFGIAAISAATGGPSGFQASFLILSAISLFSLVLGPVAAAAAIRFQTQ